MKIPAAIVLAFAVCACETRYAYVPAAGPASVLDGRAAADYTVGNPTEGAMRVAAYGVDPLTPTNAPEQRLDALHVRVVVSNTGAQPWTLDTREQSLTLGERGTSTPAFAVADRGDGSAAPVLTVPPRTTRTVDLFFPLPAGLASEADIPSFAATTRVHADVGLITQSTPFSRIEDDGANYESRSDWAYWDSPFWTNRAYVGFGGVVVAPVYWEHPVFYRPYGYGMGRPGWYGYRGGYHGGGYHGGGFRGGGGHGGHGGHR